MTNNNSSTYTYTRRRAKPSWLIAAIVVLLTAAALFVVLPERASAAVTAQAFEIVRYDVKATVNKNHTYTIDERVTVNLPADAQTLKLVTASGNLIVSDVSAGGLNYVTATENGTHFIVITSPDDLKAGEHVIDITYTIKELAERNELKDNFYFNALLPEWRQPIGEVNIEVNLPSDFVWDDLQYYAGQFGISDSGNKVEFSEDRDAGTVSITGSRIPANFGITIMADLPDGYWEDALDGIVFIYGGAVIIGAILLICFILWLIGGRDPKMPKMRQTTPVEGVSPAELGFIFDGKVNKRDIIALILYLGSRGCLRISEYAPKRYNLIRLSDPKGEEKYIRTAFNTLFEDVYEGRAIELDSAGPRLVRILKSIEIDVASGFNSNDMLSHTPLSKVFRIVTVILAALSAGTIPMMYSGFQFIEVNIVNVVLSVIIAGATLIMACILFDRADIKANTVETAYAHGASLAFLVVIGYQLVKLALLSEAYIVCAGLLVCYALMLWLVLIMQARGKGNAELVAKYRSLRKFIYRAKPKDVQAAFKENRNYYYEIVPYAYYFLGLETWAKTFKWMGVDEPVWYSDDIEGHAITHAKHKDTTIDVARSVKSFCRTLEDGLERAHRRYLRRL